MTTAGGAVGVGVGVVVGVCVGSGVRLGPGPAAAVALTRTYTTRVAMISFVPAQAEKDPRSRGTTSIQISVLDMVRSIMRSVPPDAVLSNIQKMRSPEET
jgi:hypothetical protein